VHLQFATHNRKHLNDAVFAEKLALSHVVVDFKNPASCPPGTTTWEDASWEDVWKHLYPLVTALHNQGDVQTCSCKEEFVLSRGFILESTVAGGDSFQMWRKTPLNLAGQEMPDAAFDFSVEVHVKCMQRFGDKLSDPEDESLAARPPYETMAGNRTFEHIVKPHHLEKKERTEVVGCQVNCVAAFWTPISHCGCMLSDQFLMKKDKEHPAKWWKLPWRTECNTLICL